MPNPQLEIEPGAIAPTIGMPQLDKILNRKGEPVTFDRVRIEKAVVKACKSLKSDTSFVPSLVDFVIQDLISYLKLFPNRMPGVEEIQDIVEQNLMKFNKYEIARSYIIYRETQRQKRSSGHEDDLALLESRNLNVTKRDGIKEAFDIEKIKDTYDLASEGLEEVCPFEELYEQFKHFVVDNSNTKDFLLGLNRASLNLISVDNTEWQSLAGRFLCLDLYGNASRNRDYLTMNKVYSPENYLKFFKDYVDAKHYYVDFFQYYSEAQILEAGAAIDTERDFSYCYSTMLALTRRYLLNPNGVIKELPQEMYMSVALFLAIPEKEENRLDYAIKLYNIISTQKLSLPTPTLLNARSNYHQLSSCFKLHLDDDLRSIYHGFENMAQISKFGGGVGVYMGRIRSKGAMIRGSKGASGGVLPWVRLTNDTAVAVNQLGARLGAISPTLDVWHRDINDFLGLQTETGDIRAKAFDVFPAISVPDIFMERVKDNQTWTLFDPHEVESVTGKRMEDMYGEEFNQFYKECEMNEQLCLKDSMMAKDLMKTALKVVVETGMPYFFFRDTVNEVNPNKHAGMIYSTQLCTEICQNTSPSKYVEEVEENGEITLRYKAGDTVVCNLASINMAKVYEQDEIDSVFPVAMRALDNVITLNLYPIKESEKTSNRYRSVGLGFMGLAEHLARKHMAYESEDARDYVDGLFERYAMATLKSSCELAEERGAYELFEGSEWSKGTLFGREEKWYLEESRHPDQWAMLISDIKDKGLRFSYHLAPAPNTSTSGLVGTTAGLLPIYKKLFVETNAMAPTVTIAPGLDKENFWFYKEYVNMDMKSVIDMIATVYRWVDQSISFEWMINPTEISPKDLYEYYIKSWESKLKTVYYVRSMSAEVKDACDSCAG